MIHRLLLCGVLLGLTPFAFAAPARAQERAPVTGFLNRTVAVDGTTYRYVVYVPRDYDASRAWPVVLFLHGAGERGDDGLKQSQVGIGSAIRVHPERFPAIVVQPQCPTGERWAGKPAEAALKALDAEMKEYHCDPDRQYLTGLSMGGFGSWLLASQYPDRWAAVVPICGGGSPSEMAPKLTKLPIWVFHGGADPTVPTQRSRDMVEAVKAAGSTTIQYTELPGVGHNSWDAAYANADLAKWLFEQKRSH